MACFNMLLENKKSIKELIHKNSSSDILLGQENFVGVSRCVLVPFGSGAFIFKSEARLSWYLHCLTGASPNRKSVHFNAQITWKLATKNKDVLLIAEEHL